MSVGILEDIGTGRVGLYCTTDDEMFGPLFRNTDGDEIEQFLEWIKDTYNSDPRRSPGALESLFQEFKETQT